jgi:hypothetical protein
MPFGKIFPIEHATNVRHDRRKSIANSGYLTIGKLPGHKTLGICGADYAPLSPEPGQLLDSLTP